MAIVEHITLGRMKKEDQKGNLGYERACLKKKSKRGDKR